MSAARLLTTEDAAERLGVSARSLRREIAAGRLAVVRIGRLVRIDPADVQAYIIRNRSMGRADGWQSTNVVALGKFASRSADARLGALVGLAPRKRTRKSSKRASAAILSLGN